MPRYNPQTIQSGYTLTSEQFEAVRDLLVQYSGIYVDATRQQMLTQALLQRMAATRQSFEPYIAHIGQKSGQNELHKLTELVLNHETLFFRNQPHIRALQEVILPDFHRHKPASAPLRIWSAGCSTGEEPYSLAITVLETLGHHLPRPVEIWATDLSEAALTKARTGMYRGRTLSNVPASIRARYFKQHDKTWSASDEIRRLVHFQQHNLLDDFPPWAHAIDIIFCQNVTIYFQLATCRTLIDRFHQILSQDGKLFLGFSETLWNIHEGFQLQEIKGAFVYYKKTYYHHTRDATKSVYSADRRSQETKPRRATHSGKPYRQKPAGPLQSHTAARTTPPPNGGSRATLEAAQHESERAIIQQGRDLLMSGYIEETIELLSQVPLNGSLAPQIVALVARAHANRGNLDQATAEARRAIELDPLTIEAYVLLGLLCIQQGQPVIAVQHLEHARYLDSESALISFYLAEVYRQINRSDKALREYRNTLRKLTAYLPDALLDGVAVSWIHETCQRYIETLAGKRI